MCSVNPCVVPAWCSEIVSVCPRSDCQIDLQRGHLTVWYSTCVVHNFLLHSVLNYFLLGAVGLGLALVLGEPWYLIALGLARQNEDQGFD